jgi:hypothetical protein
VRRRGEARDGLRSTSPLAADRRAPLGVVVLRGVKHAQR